MDNLISLQQYKLEKNAQKDHGFYSTIHFDEFELFVDSFVKALPKKKAKNFAPVCILTFNYTRFVEENRIRSKALKKLAWVLEKHQVRCTVLPTKKA